ncbi:PIN domain-containing protein, partial [Candidatus Berkelbacteria bacterium]|nr:PIN domain-containing protein [Candidatus Berkelbacteria bacterium]
PVDSKIAPVAAFIRRTHRLKLADSIIAATALFTGTTLITRNTQDFRKVHRLKLKKI